MLFRHVAEQTEPVRPSHFREDPNQRTDMNEATLDYPDNGKAPDKSSDYGWPEEGHEAAVPVYLTESIPADRVYRDWSAGTYTVDDTRAHQLGDTDRRRTRLVLRNLDDTNSVTIVRNATDLLFAGFTLPPGEEVVFLHTEAVWVRATASATSVSVSVLNEFEVDDSE